MAIWHGIKFLQIVSLFENNSDLIDPKADYQKEKQPFNQFDYFLICLAKISSFVT